MKCRSTRRRVLLVTAIFLVILIYKVIPREECIKSILVSTPSNVTHPFHILSLPGLVPKPISTGWKGELYPTHIKRHPFEKNVVIVTNELEQGSILAVKINEEEVIINLVDSGGKQPAFCAVVSDKIICSNYGSPNISLHQVLNKSPYIRHLSTYTLPSQQAESHPHQIVPHPLLEDLFYVPDLGLNVIYALRLVNREFSLEQELSIPRHIGIGPRHGVIAPDGQTLVIGFQNSNSISSLSIDSQGKLGLPKTSLSTLPVPSSSSHALSDVHLSSKNKIYALNRRVLAPYLEEGDSIAMFKVSSGNLIPVGSIFLPCYQPREILSIGEETFAISCVGTNGRKGGVVIIHEESVVDNWSAQGSWGMVGL